MATHAIGSPGHSWQITAQGKADAAHKGLIYAAKVMAATAADLFAKPDLIEAAKAAHRTNVGSKPYESPIPADVTPPIQPRPQ